MTTIKQNVIILQESDQPTRIYDISWRAGNMYLNRFCIDEAAGYEVLGVYCLDAKPRFTETSAEKSTDENRVKQKVRDSQRTMN